MAEPENPIVRVLALELDGLLRDGEEEAVAARQASALRRYFASEEVRNEIRLWLPHRGQAQAFLTSIHLTEGPGITIDPYGYSR